MTPLPRTECPWCKNQVPIRVNGALREHKRKRGSGLIWYGSGRIALLDRGLALARELTR